MCWKGSDGEDRSRRCGVLSAAIDERKWAASLTTPDRTKGVAKLGIKPEEVTDVVVTHMHWDHADGIDLFPKAKVWIQKDEYTYYTGKTKQASGKDADDELTYVAAARQAKRRGGAFGWLMGTPRKSSRG